MKLSAVIVTIFALLCLVPSGALANAIAISDATQDCIDCHNIATPGIVEDWMRSQHSKITPGEALKKEQLGRLVSAEKVAENLSGSVVGCAECHTNAPDKHADTFDHNGYKVHVVVTPRDCAACHPVEEGQYGNNLMSHAYGNLHNNPVYHGLSEDANAVLSFAEGKLTPKPVDDESAADSCYQCHGTVIGVKGKETRKVTLGGEMDFPVLTGWPNQGVGRINPDGSMGACTACHTRHQFSIAMARKPATCSECHKGPDVPAYASYLVSKHGNLYESVGDDWDWKTVPWKLGVNFTAPTCATCHVSLLTDPSGSVVVERTHQMSDRLAWRLMGLIYAAPHPKSPDTSIIKNKAGLPLPTELTGEPAQEFLIDAAEQAKRRAAMREVCTSCHSGQWTDNQFKRFENTIKMTNEQTLAATKIMLSAWEKGAAKGLAQKDSIFNEPLERKWVEQWLFYANSTRFSSAMLGQDYGVFANGRWYLTKNLQEMNDWMTFKLNDLKK